MTPQRWKQIEELYHSARERGPAEREEYLRQACGDDQPLRDQLQVMLEQDRCDNEILDRPAMDLLSEAGPETLPAGTILGPYRIEFLLGAGGMGRVYQAHDSRLGRSVAIKVAAQRFSDRFSREARAIAALNHPNICTLYDIGPDYLVMELVEGPTLADRIRHGPIPLGETLSIARQIAEGLDAAHGKGIVHRDLKPANIKVRPDGTVKVLDFGVAKAAEPEGVPDASPMETQDRTEPGRVLGTAAYMAPEQASGAAVDKRADIWAFGVVVYEMLTGRRPFAGATARETIAAVLKEHPDFRRVPPAAVKMLERCLEKDPRRRLRDIADALPILEEAPAVPAIRHAWLPWAAGAAALVAAATISLVHFREFTPAPELVQNLQIILPENIKFTSGGAFAVSPDGRRLVFAAIGSDNVPRLWLRLFESSELTPLQGSQTTPIDTTLIWSPDSRFVVFRVDQRLVKIDVLGGLPQTLCDGPQCKVLDIPGGGSWNRNGTIIFGAGSDPLGIMQVPAGGGVPIPVTLSDEPLQAHGFPSFLPDGQHFLYSRWSKAAPNRGMFIGVLGKKPEEQDSKMLLRLDRPSESSTYVPASNSRYGELLFMRGQTLLAQRFDERRLALAGEPVTVAEHVGVNNFGMGWFSASSNGKLVYRTGGPGVSKQIAWLDRKGNMMSTPCETGTYRTDMLRLSPDGTRAAYHQFDENTSNGDIWAADLVGGGNLRITGIGTTRAASDPTSSGYPVWSPDGKRMAFQFSRGRFTGIYQKASSGVGGEDPLLKLEVRAQMVHLWEWTQDGRFLVYSLRDPSNVFTRSDIWAVPIVADATGQHKPVPILMSDAKKLYPRVSPDGRWLAYMSNESGRDEIYVQPFRVGAQPPTDKSGTFKKVLSQGTLGMPHWRRDGRELVYLSLDGAVMSVPIAAGPEFRSEKPQLLFRLPADFFPLATNPGLLVDPTADHDRFLLLLPANRTKLDEFTVVLNWAAGLEMKKYQPLVP